MTLTPIELPHERTARVHRTLARDLRGAPLVSTRTSYFQTPGQAMVPEWSAADAVRWAYYANVFVYACVRAIAEDIAALDFKAGRDPKHIADDDPECRLARLLGPPPGGPAPLISPKTWWEWTISQLLVTGRFSHEITYDSAGVPDGLWPVPSQVINPVPSTQPGVWWDAFIHRGGQQDRRLDAKNVFYYWRPAMYDIRQPESVLQSARLDVSVAVMQDRYDYAFLKNDARPASVIVHEAFQVTDEKEAFKQQFTAEHAGPDNAGRPIFVEADPNGASVAEAIKVIPIGLTHKDAEFIARYARKVQAICIAFGVPLTRLGDSSDRTFNNTGQEWETYYSKLMGIARELSDAVNMNIAERCGPEVGWFDTRPLRDSIRGTRFNNISVIDGVKTFVVTINEARSELGLPPVPEGDRMLTPAEAALISNAGTLLSPAQLVLEPDQEVVVSEQSPASAANPSAQEPAPSALPEAGPGEDDDGDRFTPLSTSPPLPEALRERRTYEYRRKIRTIVTLEHGFERDFQRLLNSQRDAVLARLEGKRGRQALRAAASTVAQGGDLRAAPTARELFDLNYWRDRTSDEMRDDYEAVFSGAANDLLLDLQSTSSFDVHNPLAQQFIQHRANKLAHEVTDVTYQAIQDQLEAGIVEGESIPKLAARIRDLFDQTYARRAETVARTETISAYNGATLTTGDALGAEIVAGFEWLSTQDDRVRPAHEEADGQTITRGDRFDVGGYPMRYPGDPDAPPALTVNCRCTVLSLTPEEFDDNTSSGDTVTDIISRSRRWRTLTSAQDLLLSFAGVTPKEGVH